MKKRILSLLLALCLSFGFAACAQKKEAAPTQNREGLLCQKILANDTLTPKTES